MTLMCCFFADTVTQLRKRLNATEKQKLEATTRSNKEVREHTCIQAHMQARTQTHAPTHVCTHARMYAQRRIHIHIHAHVLSLTWRILSHYHWCRWLSDLFILILTFMRGLMAGADVGNTSLPQAMPQVSWCQCCCGFTQLPKPQLPGTHE